MSTRKGWDAGQPLCVGGVTLRNRVFLAPMSGVSDAPFRRLAWRFGAGAVVSEMVASEHLLTGDREMVLRSDCAGLPVPIVQLAGREAEWLARAARMAQDQGATIIDFNMGCPARKVTSGQCGSALMREPDHALRLVEAIIDAVEVPVTVKMRLGWDWDCLNAPEIAARAVNAGASMITVHGRTRCQFYKGRADWQAVAAVREAVDVPLVVNGDIATMDDIGAAITASGADAVMVGRASYGAPWLPGALAGADIEPLDVLDLALEHHDAMLTYYGATLGIRHARKHLAWYFEHCLKLPEPALRRRILTSNDPAEIHDLIRRSALPVGDGAIAEAA